MNLRVVSPIPLCMEDGLGHLFLLSFVLDQTHVFFQPRETSLGLFFRDTKKKSKKKSYQNRRTKKDRGGGGCWWCSTSGNSRNGNKIKNKIYIFFVPNNWKMGENSATPIERRFLYSLHQVTHDTDICVPSTKRRLKYTLSLHFLPSRTTKKQQTSAITPPLLLPHIPYTIL